MVVKAHHESYIIYFWCPDLQQQPQHSIQTFYLRCFDQRKCGGVVAQGMIQVKLFSSSDEVTVVTLTL